MAYGLTEWAGAWAARSTKVPNPPFRWSGVKGPWFDNNVACLEATPKGLQLWWRTGVVNGGDELHPAMEETASLTIVPRGRK